MNTLDTTQPSGAWEVRRRIKIPGLVHKADVMALEDKVGSLSGVRGVTSDMKKHQIIVRYDVTGLDYHSIIRVLEEAGFPPLNNWWCRFKTGWFQNLDTNARDNAKASPPACCNRPPK